MTSIGTATRTATITLTDVRHVFWRIQTDLRILRAQHGMITAQFEEQISHDLLFFIYRNYITAVEFRFIDPTTRQRKEGSTLYDIARNWAGETDHEGGGLRYRNLSGAEFTIVVTYSEVWRQLSPADQNNVRASLKLHWGPAGSVSPGGGSWVADRTYSSGGLSASRSVFRAS